MKRTNRTIKYTKNEGTSAGTITIIMEAILFEADSLGISKIDHEDQSIVIHA